MAMTTYGTNLIPALFSVDGGSLFIYHHSSPRRINVHLITVARSSRVESGESWNRIQFKISQSNDGCGVVMVSSWEGKSFRTILRPVLMIFLNTRMTKLNLGFEIFLSKASLFPPHRIYGNQKLEFAHKLSILDTFNSYDFDRLEPTDKIDIQNTLDTSGAAKILLCYISYIYKCIQIRIKLLKEDWDASQEIFRSNKKEDDGVSILWKCARKWKNRRKIP